MIKIALMMMICTASGWGADHYVRSGAAGNGNGNDWTNAYGQLPANLVRGDTYYIADGTYGRYDFDDEESSRQLITVKKAIATDHGTETGWQSTYGDGEALFNGDLVFRTGDYVLDGQTRSDMGGGYGIRIQIDGGYNINCLASRITFRYIDVENGGITGPNGRNFQLTTNSPSDITISHCYVHDVNGINFRSVNAHRLVVEYSYIARNESDPVDHAEAIADNDSDSIIFRHNVFEDIEGSGIIVTGNGASYTGDGENWKIYGNVFYNTPEFTAGCGGVINIMRGTATNWVIYNNSIISVIGLQAGVSGADRTVGFQTRNNMWYGCPTHTVYTPNADYNWYYGNYREGMGELDTRAAAAEEHGQLGTENPFVDTGNRDFSLTGPTDAGATLDAEYGTDMFGNVRGADGVWDRGAIEFTAAGSSLPFANFQLPANPTLPNPMTINAIEKLRLKTADFKLYTTAGQITGPVEQAGIYLVRSSGGIQKITVIE